MSNLRDVLEYELGVMTMASVGLATGINSSADSGVPEGGDWMQEVWWTRHVEGLMSVHAVVSRTKAPDKETSPIVTKAQKKQPRDPRPRARDGTGTISDYITGQAVRATTEETEAVQVFARRLVEDYGYSKEQVQTRPQHRVRVRPSDEDRSYPVDIAVFRSSKRTEDDLFMVVECKKKDRKDGEHQLRLYLDMSAAEVGVWFNGEDHIYLRKVHYKDGRRTYEPLPNIPRCGQRIEDISLYKRKDLTKPSNLKAVFRDLRNHLAGMTTGITRDEALAQEIITILFCKILDEQETDPDDTVSFRAGVDEPHKEVQKRIRDLFERVKDAVYGDVFEATDRTAWRGVVGQLTTASADGAARRR